MQATPQKDQFKKVSKGRLHLITSCTECHKRKQKCDQEQPCKNCARRYPLPACMYPTREIISRQNHHSTVSQLGILPGPPEEALQTLNSNSERQDSEWIASLDEPSRRGPFPTFESPRNRQLRNDEVIELVHIQDPGQGYQKLLSLMLSSPALFIDTDSNREEELEPNDFNFQEIGTAGQSGSRYQSEKLKWEIWQSTHGGIPKTCFGISSVEPLHYLPIKPTALNGQLLQIFVKVLVKFVVSIDGNPSPNFYNDNWVPWSIKTPLLAQVAIYTASCYQSEAQRIPAAKSTVVLRHKLKTISLLNETLRSSENSTSDDAIASVVYLTTNEWYWGSKENVMAHMSGVKQMVKLRGGVDALDNIFLKKTILLCDYHIACSYNFEPSFPRSFPFSSVQWAQDQYPVQMSTPFLASQRAFADHAHQLGIGDQSAIILDDMRFLLSSMTNMAGSDQELPNGTEDQIIMVTATWICDRISKLPEANTMPITLADDYIYQSCRKAALVYCKAILERTSLSRACTLQDLNQLWSTIWRVPLSQWKKIPGIFIWILLSANQAALDTAHGRFLKSMFKSASFYVALENWEVVDGMLGAFVKLQRWLRERNQRMVVVEES